VKVLDVLPIAQPIDMMPLIADMSQVMAGIPKDSRVFMAFEDPGDVYENVYSGYRRFIELPSYVASNQQFLLLPEWWGVFELNYPGAPEIWGRSPEAVLTNATYWDADYVMIYQEKETTLAPEWENQNFELMGSFDWRDYASYFKNHKKFDPLQLKFFILKRP
jgi:hypothetical protein